MFGRDKMRSKFANLAIFYGLMASTDPEMQQAMADELGSPRAKRKLTKEDVAKLKALELDRRERAKVQRYMRQGLKPFKYGTNGLWALNQENADRKAKKRGWI